MKQNSHIVNRFIALVSCLAMIITISSVPAFAAQITKASAPSASAEQISPRTTVYHHYSTYRYGDIEDGFPQKLYIDDVKLVIGSEVVTFQGYVYLDYVEPYSLSYRATYSGDLVGYTND